MGGGKHRKNMMKYVEGQKTKNARVPRTRGNPNPSACLLYRAARPENSMFA